MSLFTPPLSRTHRTVLLQPGIYGSGAKHWQSLWEQTHSDVRRIPQDDWDRPDRYEWMLKIDEAVAECPAPPVIVAHSLGCLAVAHWCASRSSEVHSILMVAVPDPDGPNFPQAATGFSPPPKDVGGRRTVVVSSDDDPYSGTEYIHAMVRSWAADHVKLGKAGHINADSGLGHWNAGWQLVRAVGGVEPLKNVLPAQT